MVISCCVPKCRERFVKGGKVSFHWFPDNTDLKAKWIYAIARTSTADWVFKHHNRVCSRHFDPSCFKIFNGKAFLNLYAVPTRFDFSDRKLKSSKILKKRKQKINNSSGAAKVGDSVSEDVESQVLDGVVREELRGVQLEADVVLTQRSRVPDKLPERERRLQENATSEEHAVGQNGCWQQGGTDLLTVNSTPAQQPTTVCDKAASNGTDAAHEEKCPEAEGEYDIIAFLAKPCEKESAGLNGCLLCGRTTGLAVSVLQRTNATCVPLGHRLQVLAEKAGLQPPRGSLLCTRCMHVLNYADRIELELGLLHRTIADSVCTTHHLNLPLPV